MAGIGVVLGNPSFHTRPIEAKLLRLVEPRVGKCQVWLGVNNGKWRRKLRLPEVRTYTLGYNISIGVWVGLIALMESVSPRYPGSLARPSMLYAALHGRESPRNVAVVRFDSVVAVSSGALAATEMQLGFGLQLSNRGGIAA